MILQNKQHLLKYILDKIKRIGFLKFNANLVFLFVVYSAIFAFVLFAYGFINTRNVTAEKANIKDHEIQIAAEEFADIMQNDFAFIEKTSVLLSEWIRTDMVDENLLKNMVLPAGSFSGIYATQNDVLRLSIGQTKLYDMNMFSNSGKEYLSVFYNNGLLWYKIAQQEIDILITKEIPDTFYTVIRSLERVLADSDEKPAGFKGTVILTDGNKEAFCLYNAALHNVYTLRTTISIVRELEENSSQAVKKNDTVYYYQPVGHTGWAVIVSVPAAAMSGAVDYSFVGVSSVVLIILLLLLFWRFRSSIYIPIKRIEHAMDVVVDGDDVDFEVKIDENSELYSIAQYFNRMISRLKEYANREYTAKMLSKQAELSALQSQINPHFLYNTLDSIRGLALLEGQDNIARMTKALSSLFKYSISKTENLSTLGEEVKNVENYLTIQQYRFSGKFIVIKDIDLKENPHILSYRLPKLTIQPIVENAIYHGLETKIGKGSIKISAYTTEKRLVITIEDDGIGISQDKLEQINERLHDKECGTWEEPKSKSSGVAIVNVNERIQLYFGDMYGVSVYSTPSVGTTVEIVVPLIQEDIQT